MSLQLSDEHDVHEELLKLKTSLPIFACHATNLSLTLRVRTTMLTCANIFTFVSFSLNLRMGLHKHGDVMLVSEACQQSMTSPDGSQQQSRKPCAPTEFVIAET
ncbi:hypothetical protein [Mycobacterium phage WXIN]|nr:hypothetical protein [Mycobacterium phage WXIN]